MSLNTSYQAEPDRMSGLLREHSCKTGRSDRSNSRVRKLPNTSGFAPPAVDMNTTVRCRLPGLVVVKHAQRLGTDTRLGPWLFTVARNLHVILPLGDAGGLGGSESDRFVAIQPGALLAF